MVGKRFTRASLVVVCMLLMATTGLGQITTGSVDGTVRDASGAVLPGASVSISSPELPSGPQTFITDANGRFRFRNLPPGIYGLTVELSGFGTYNEEDLRVSVGGNIERIVSLGLASVAETITVTGESPMVDTRKSGISTNYSNEYMEQTPLLRFSMFDFTKSAPGMSATAPTRGSSSATSAYGSGTDESTWLLDGTDFTSPVGGAAWPWPDTDSIEEIEILSLGASAEYQVAGGAVMNAITKQGTNEVRFDVSYYGQFDAVTSSPVKVDCGGCPDGDENGETGYSRARFVDVTGHVGFPIIKDKMWLYAGAQAQRDHTNQPGTDPRFARKVDADRINWKYTWQITRDIKFQHTYHNDYWVIPSTPSVSRPFDTIWGWRGQNPTITFGNITHVLSQNTFYDVRVSGFYSPNDPSDPNNPGVSRRTDEGTGIASGGAPATYFFTQSRTAVNFKLSHYASDWIGADHDFKFGGSFVDGWHSETGAYTNGIAYYDYYGAQDYAYLQEPYNNGGEFKATGLFVEDTVRIGDRATVQIGVRFDRFEAISPDIDTRDQDGNTNGRVAGLGSLYTTNNIGPRVGFNVKLDDEGKTVVRGNLGLYFRQPITGELARIHPSFSPLTLANFAPPPGMEAACSEIRFDGSLAACYSDIVSVTTPGTSEAIAADTKSPKTVQASIGFDRELGANVAFGFTYIRKNGSQYNGWLVQNAEYESIPHTAPNGSQFDVFNILTDPSDRFFLMGNQPRFFMNYDGIQLQLRKRFSNNWQLQGSYNWGNVRGLMGRNGSGPASSQDTDVAGSSLGRDPNDFTNAEGQLLNDRTHMFTITGGWDMPGGVRLAANLRGYTGKPWAAQERVSLDQGTRSVYIENVGDRRLSWLGSTDVRISKAFRFEDTMRFEFLVDFLNLTNVSAEEDLVTRSFTSGNFGVPDRWVDPRRMMIGIKFVY